MATSEKIFLAVTITTVILSLFWGLIWSISTISRLQHELRKKELND